jgi:hypothetical protein
VKLSSMRWSCIGAWAKTDYPLPWWWGERDLMDSARVKFEEIVSAAQQGGR